MSGLDCLRVSAMGKTYTKYSILHLPTPHRVLLNLYTHCVDGIGRFFILEHNVDSDSRGR